MDNSAKIFGIGFSKTGTTSLEYALEHLGYSVCKGHYNNNHTNYLLSLFVNGDKQEIMRLTDYFNAFADGPWGGTDLYKDLVKKYPDAKFILTLRDPEKWYDSFVKMFLKHDAEPATTFDTFHSKGRYGTVYFFKWLFKIENLSNNKEIILKYYNDYNKNVIDFFKSTPEKLLIIDLTNGDGWNILCPFLGKEIPKIDFPHKNPTIKPTEDIVKQNVLKKKGGGVLLRNLAGKIKRKIKAFINQE